MKTSLSLLHPDDCLPGWRDLLTGEDEQAVVERYGRPVGLGNRPALLVIDFQLAYLGKDEPLLPQIDEFPAASGQRGWKAFGQAMRVLEAARGIHLPIYATRVAFDPSVEKDVSFAAKRVMPASFAVGSIYTQLPDQLQLSAGERLADKSAASAFFGTALDDFIASHRIDSLLITGLSTSGCVRSTVVDAAARGLRPVVVVDAVGDRLQISHTVALLDIWMKYGDLCNSDGFIRFARDRLSRPDESHANKGK